MTTERPPSEASATLDVDSARVMRDACFEAMDALNDGLVECLHSATPESETHLRLAVARAMDGMLRYVLEPLLKQHPALEIPEESWGEVARERMLRRSGL